MMLGWRCKSKGTGKMKTRIRSVLAVVSVFLAGHTLAGTLAVPLRGQEMDNWCWAGCSEMILDYFGHDVSQEDIATWAVGGRDVANSLYPFPIGPFFDNGVYMKRGIPMVLKQFGPVDSSYRPWSLSLENVKSEIDGNRPFVVAVRWVDSRGRWPKDAGGHVVVCSGYSGDLVSLQDPYPSDFSPRPGNPGVSYLVSYDSLFNDRRCYHPFYGSAAIGNKWTETLKTGRALDVCFLIDSTGSMGDDISYVKSSAQSLIDDLTARAFHD